MNCIICTEPIPDTGTMTYPCQCPPLHTLCAFRNAYTEYRDADCVACPHCRTIYIDHRPRPNETTFEITDLFRTDLKNLKKKRGEANRLRATFVRKLNEVYRQFRERILMSLEFIEVEKERAIGELKESSEFLNARRAVMGVYSYESRLKTKHNLGYDEYRTHVGFEGRYGRVRKAPLAILKRKFRLRI